MTQLQSNQTFRPHYLTFLDSPVSVGTTDKNNTKTTTLHKITN